MNGKKNVLRNWTVDFSCLSFELVCEEVRMLEVLLQAQSSSSTEQEKNHYVMWTCKVLSVVSYSNFILKHVHTCSPLLKHTERPVKLWKLVNCKNID